MLVRKPGIILRTIAAGCLLASAGLSGPPLTSIQDVLYRADGTRFNGTLTISWKTFEAADTSNIPTQTITSKVVDGNLMVQLVPGTNATHPAYYTVKYTSDGKVQFEETWAVPPSSLVLRVRDVRVTSASALEQNGPLQETDIVGLSADLGARPIKGPGYAPGRVVYTTAAGALEAVAGDPSDCVRTDGSTGPCGTPGDPTTFIDSEVPAGLADGANATFTLASVPNPPSSLSVYRNGMLQKVGLDYNASGNTLQFVTAAIPQPGDTLLASYRLSAAAQPPWAIPGSPQVLCAGAGSSTNGTTVAALGTCSIPAGILQPGDRVEIRFDYGHQGSSTGFNLEVAWGGTVILQRSATASETLVTGRIDSGFYTTGAQFSAQSWGTSLALAASLTSASDFLSTLAGIEFRAGMSQATSDSVSLRNFLVIRYPRSGW